MSFPQMAGAFWNWDDEIELQVVENKPVDYEAIDVPQNNVVFLGVLQPITGRELLIKPEGERKFNYLNLWTEQELKADAIVMTQTGESYRVIKKQKWNVGDYQAYELIETPNPPFAGS